MNEGLGGAVEIAIGELVIPADLLSEITPEFTEGAREKNTLAGTFNRPSGTLDTAQLTFQLYLPSIDYLKDIFPDRYNAPAGNTTGNIIWDTNNCATVSGVPVNVHYTCEGDDANDVHIYNGRIAMSFNPTYNQTDDLTLEVTVHALPDEQGRVFRLGTGDLTQESIWDPATGTSVPVGS